MNLLPNFWVIKGSGNWLLHVGIPTIINNIVRFKDALEIFNLGLNSHARPQKRLQDSMSLFQHKLMMEMEDNPNLLNSDDCYRNPSTSGLVIPQDTLHAKGNRLQVFQDDNPTTNPEKIPFFERPWNPSAFPDYKTNWKENSLIASPWMGVTFPQKTALPLKKRSFHIYRLVRCIVVKQGIFNIASFR